MSRRETALKYFERNGDYELKVAYDGKEYDLDMNILSSRENINRIVLK